MKEQLEGRFQMKTAIIGHSAGSDVVREGNILNRIIRASSRGWEYECDQRHVEVLVQELELEAARSLSAPGVDEPVDKDEDLEVALDPDAASSYRALAARCNYIAVDRADAQFAIKELCRDMANPVVASWSKLVRLGR